MFAFAKNVCRWLGERSRGIVRLERKSKIWRMSQSEYLLVFVWVSIHPFLWFNVIGGEEILSCGFSFCMVRKTSWNHSSSSSDSTSVLSSTGILLDKPSGAICFAAGTWISLKSKRSIPAIYQLRVKFGTISGLLTICQI